MQRKANIFSIVKEENRNLAMFGVSVHRTSIPAYVRTKNPISLLDKSEVF